MSTEYCYNAIFMKTFGYFLEIQQKKTQQKQTYLFKQS